MIDLGKCLNRAKQFQPRLVTKETEEYLLRATKYLPRDAPLKQRYYCVRNEIEQIPTCIGCGKSSKWDNYTNVFRDYCSTKCYNTAMRGEAGKLRAACRKQFRKVGGESIDDIVASLTREDGNLNGNMINNRHLSNVQITTIENATQHLPANYSLSGRVFVLSLDDFDPKEISCRECSSVLEINGKNRGRLYCSAKCSNRAGEKIAKTRQTNIDRYGVSSNLVVGKITPEMQQRLRDGAVGELYQKGLTVPEIEMELGISTTRAYTLLNQWAEENDITLKKRSYSFIQRRVAQGLSNRGIDFLEGDRKIIAPYELDFVLEDRKVAVEINGIYWHSEKFKDKWYHVKKADLARDNDYRLLQFTEDEVNLNFDLVMSMIDTTRTVVYARKCKVEEISPKVYRDFLGLNHIQGPINSRIKLGLFHNDVLVSVIGMGAPRFNKIAEWEIHRFCTTIGMSVVGGFSKLLSNFSKKYSGDILSYADKRFSCFHGNVYEKSGFELISETPPSYAYHHATKPSLSRYAAQKHRLPKILGDKYCSERSERDNMKLSQYFRVWDAGQLVYLKR